MPLRQQRPTQQMLTPHGSRMIGNWKLTTTSRASRFPSGREDDKLAYPHEDY
jgi:hypothetical protein